MSDQVNSEAMTAAREANSLLVIALASLVGGVLLGPLSQAPLGAAIGLALLGGLLAVLIGFLYFFKIVNVMNGLATKIDGLVADFRASTNRKYELQKTVVDLAERLSGAEKSIHRSVVSEVRSAARDIATSPNPSLVFANLATSFPELKNFQGFVAAQRTAVEIEEKIDDDVRGINGLGATYNEIRVQFPATLFVSSLFRHFEHVASEDELGEFQSLRVEFAFS